MSTTAASHHTGGAGRAGPRTERGRQTGEDRESVERLSQQPASGQGGLEGGATAPGSRDMGPVHQKEAVGSRTSFISAKRRPGEAIREHFQEAFRGPRADELERELDSIMESLEPVEAEPFSEEEILKAVQACADGKATGLDGVPVEIIKAS